MNADLAEFVVDRVSSTVLGAASSGFRLLEQTRRLPILLANLGGNSIATTPAVGAGSDRAANKLRIVTVLVVQHSPRDASELVG